jgi:lysophospholipase L1-like esterase
MQLALRKGLRALLVACVIATAALLLLELGARLLADVLGISPYMQYDERIGWTARPNAFKRHRDRAGQFDVNYRINELGYRGTAYAKEKPQGTFRIVILGDSTGFGWGVSELDTFSAIIDRELPSTEVINLSLSGYGTDQSFLKFVDIGIGFKPDLVILQISHNDFEEIMHPFFNQKPKPHFVGGPDGKLALANVPARPRGARMKAFYANSLPVPFKEWLGWNSYAFNLLNELYYGVRRQNAGPAGPATSIYSKESVSMLNAIARMLHTSVSSIGAHGVIVFSAESISVNRYIDENHMQLLDLYPRFLEAGSGDAAYCYFADGYHWNTTGHRIAANELMQVIKQARN